MCIRRRAAGGPAAPRRRYAMKSMFLEAIKSSKRHDDFKSGYDNGYEIGYQRGYHEGYNAGRTPTVTRFSYTDEQRIMARMLAKRICNSYDSIKGPDQLTEALTKALFECGIDLRFIGKLIEYNTTIKANDKYTAVHAELNDLASKFGMEFFAEALLDYVK